MHEAEESPLWDRVRLAQYGEEKLGRRHWGLLCSYGKMMSGAPFGGHYVSGVPCDLARAIVDALLRGETVDVHLMHRHVSGNYETSSLRLRNGQLWMVFDDREELA